MTLLMLVMMMWNEKMKCEEVKWKKDLEFKANGEDDEIGGYFGSFDKYDSR
jgi:hypothetical protein